MEDCTLNGHPTERLPGNLNVSFAHVQGEALLMALKNIAVSSGSACTSASVEPSYVLRALGVPDELAHGSIRFGIGRFNTRGRNRLRDRGSRPAKCGVYEASVPATKWQPGWFEVLSGTETKEK